MPLLSVITPAYKPEREYLLAAYESLASQAMPSGWEWEWVVQEDGETGEVRAMLPDDERIRPAEGRRFGLAPTRNMALARTRGALVKNLDADDLLTEGVLSRDISALSDDAIGWSTSRVLDLMPDGSTIGFPSDPPEGVLAVGFVYEHWRSHDFRAPVHPTTICIRRSLAAELGGWMAIPGSDDTGLLIPASLMHPGYFNAEVGLLYRKWPGQVTAAAGHSDAEEKQIRMTLIDDRAKAIISRRGKATS